MSQEAVAPPRMWFATSLVIFAAQNVAGMRVWLLSGPSGLAGPASHCCRNLSDAYGYGAMPDMSQPYAGYGTNQLMGGYSYQPSALPMQVLISALKHRRTNCHPHLQICHNQQQVAKQMCTWNKKCNSQQNQ